MSAEAELTLNLPPAYPYAYETHLHTSEASACGMCPGVEMARAHKAAGYTGIIVTDHFVHGNTRIDRRLPWSEWVEGFCSGYEHARAEGDRIGLQVFFGWEACYDGTEFLINGLSKEWLLAHPEIRDCTVEEQFHLVHEGGGLIVHCHPFREASYLNHISLFPLFTDAVEVVNAAHKDPSYDEQARLYARIHNFPVTAGSDIHRTTLSLGGMAFQHKLNDAGDYIRAVMNREPCLLLCGNGPAATVPYMEFNV
ncbi:MAG: PHP domain-containing protein [Butyrivibrio sp.]|nr:PHP domain-containing protein [Butyrivibrio sp.]